MSSNRPSVRIEFYGIPRERAGVAEAVVEFSAADIALCDVLQELANRFPALAGSCIDRGRLRHGFTVNVDGERFVTDPRARISPGETLLFLSADAGG